MRHDESLPPTHRRPALSAAAALTALSLGVAGCGGGGAAQAQPGKGGERPRPRRRVRPRRPRDAVTGAYVTVPVEEAHAPLAASGTRLPGPLSGKTVVIDPGHNPRNHLHTAEINRQVDIGTTHKECDTTGTSTNSGYAEASFTLDVSRRLRTLLQAQGARVVLTYDDDRAYGPCVDERARIGNKAGADAVVSVHADGSAVGNRGFHVILPAAVRGGGRGHFDDRGSLARSGYPDRRTLRPRYRKCAFQLHRRQYRLGHPQGSRWT